MESKNEVKSGDTTSSWAQRSASEIESAEAKSAINLYGVAGIVIIITGVLIALFSSIPTGTTIFALGFVVMGIGEILRYLNKLSKRT